MNASIEPLSDPRNEAAASPQATRAAIPRRRQLLSLVLVFFVTSTALKTVAAQYAVGQVVTNFALVNRATGQPMQLADFAGKIVVLDWFAWWCPYCQAAGPQLLDGIDRYYATRGGNPEGIPVVHVGVNLQPNQESQTQNFINRAGLELVLNDFDRAVANRFSSGGQPIFAIINGVTNSPSHQPWQLLYSQNGYGQTTFPIDSFRAAIDAVKAPLPLPARLLQPRLRPDRVLELTVDGQSGRSYRVEASTNLLTWTNLFSLTATNSRHALQLMNAPGEERRFYRVISQ